MTPAGKNLLKIYQSAKTAKFAGGAKSDQRNAVLSMLHDAGSLKTGVEELLKAAAARFTADDQQLYLQAAQFGKTFVRAQPTTRSQVQSLEIVWPLYCDVVLHCYRSTGTEPLSQSTSSRTSQQCVTCLSRSVIIEFCTKLYHFTCSTVLLVLSRPGRLMIWSATQLCAQPC